MQKYNNNDGTVNSRVNKLSFVEWAKEKHQLIYSSLLTDGINFINEQAERLNTPVANLLLDNRWHYLDKPKKKQSYRGEITYNSDGVPHLKLTYYTFRHGGQRERFNSKEAIKALWLQERCGIPLKSAFKACISTPKQIKTTPALQINWLKHDLALWKSLESASNTVNNPYLKRKGLSGNKVPGLRTGIDKLPNELLTKGCRQSKKSIVAVKIIDAQGNYQGLQKIDNQGLKRYTKGLSKKGNFALIGDYSLPEKLQTVHVCEGVATAASIFLATGEPVFAAMDAFNLLPVCRNLKKRYPKTPFQIWADNDWQKANKPLKEGRVLGNTGLIHANRTAFKLRNAKVCTPDFDDFPEHLIKNATDFNDLHSINGRNSIIETPVKQPDVALALWHELHQSEKRAHGVISPNQFSRGKKTTYHQRFLPANLFERAGEGIHLIRSAIGSGKTEIVEKLLKKHPEKSVLFTTHLISLVESAASRLNLVSYNECDNYDLQIESRVAICLNSLGKLTAEGRLRHYDIVVIDEVEQVLARLTTKIEQKPLVFNVLKKIMQNAKMLICLDAHLSQVTAQLVQRFCPEKPVTVHFNTYKPGCKREIILHDSKEHLQIEAMKNLSNNKTAYLAFNAKKEAYKTFAAIKTAFPDKKGLYISSDSAGEKEAKAFFNDVNRASKHYDYIICTPSVSTGVSIDNNHFDFVGGIFNAQVNTANDCMQALGRIRNHETLHVFCEKRVGNKALSPEIISAKWSQTHAYDLSLMNITESGSQILLNPGYENLTLLVTQARNRSFNDFYEQFCLLALQDGIAIQYSEETLELSLKRQVKQFKSACVDEEWVTPETLQLSAIELKNLANKPRKTMAETATYKKQQIIAFYNLATSDEDNINALIQADNEGRFRKRLLNLELALGDEALAKQRFLMQLDDGAQFAADLTHYASLQALFKRLLATLHLNTNHGLLSTEDFRYDTNTFLESDFFQWVEANRGVLQGLISLPKPHQIKANPISFISYLLGKLGLKQKRVGRAENGFYHLDVHRIELMNALISRRQSNDSSVTLPLDATSQLRPKSTAVNILMEGLARIKAFLTPKTAMMSIPI